MSRSAKSVAHQRQSNATTKKKTFQKNALALALFGSHHSHLAMIENTLGIVIHARGNEVTFAGDAENVARAISVLEALYERLERGQEIAQPEVDAMLRFSEEPPERMARKSNTGVNIRDRMVTARTPTQADYLRAIDESELVFGEGPPGPEKPIWRWPRRWNDWFVVTSNALFSRVQLLKRASSWAFCQVICAKKSIRTCVRYMMPCMT